MSKIQRSFLECVLDGCAMFDEIDDYIDQWHESDDDRELHHFLGMTEEEYSLWVTDPGYLTLILAARAAGRSLSEVANDNYADLAKLAARSNHAREMARLKDWLEVQEQSGL